MTHQFIFFLSILCLVLTGCQKKSTPSLDKKQILRLNVHAEPPTMDARKAIDTSSTALIGLCFEGLMRRVEGSDPVPALAERYEVSPDKLTYTFYLRDAKWWDGKPVTAKDFEYTWKAILEPAFPSGFANDLYVIKGAEEAKTGKGSADQIGIRVLDDKTLQVELKNPIPYFLELVTSHSFLPVPHHIASVNPRWADNSDSLVGNGPFKLAKWRHHNQMLFVRNSEYWDGEGVKLEEIHLLMVPDETTELNMFEAGELDWAGHPLSNLPTDALYALSQQNRLSTYLIAGTYYYIFNVHEFPFNNVNLRRAFALAINRQEIIENITMAHQLPAMGLIPPTMWPVGSGFFKDNDLEAARRYFDLALKEMGLTKEQFPTITLSYNTISAHHKIAQAIQHQWFYAFGIRVRLKNKEWKVFLDELGHKQFQIARMGGIAGFNDPISFLDQYRYGNSTSNYSGWVNARYTALIEEAERNPVPAERKQLLREAEAILLDEMPIIPIFFYTGSYVNQPYVRDIQLSELSEVNFKLAHVEW